MKLQYNILKSHNPVEPVIDQNSISHLNKDFKVLFTIFYHFFYILKKRHFRSGKFDILKNIRMLDRT